MHNGTKNNKTMRIVGKVISVTVAAVLIIYCISLLIPLFWTVTTSFKAYDEYYLRPFQFPKRLIFENYKNVLSKLNLKVLTTDGTEITYGIPEMFLYSVLFSTGYSAFFVLVFALVAYVMARYKFFGRNFLFSLGIFIMVLPIIGDMPSKMTVYKQLGVYNNMLLFILVGPSTAFSGFNFLLLHGSFRKISWEYAEAAFIDGGGHYTVLIRIMLPMILPTMFVLFVLGFLSCWNSYATFLIWLPSYPSLSYGMYKFQLDAPLYEASMPEILAGFMIIIIPTSLLYLASQKVIASKLTVGGLKG